MATPMETNTEELREVLQQVYNLPDRASGDNGEPDLVVAVDGTASDKHIFALNTEDLSIVSGDVDSTITKIANGDYAKILVKFTYTYSADSHHLNIIPEIVDAVTGRNNENMLCIRFGPLPHYTGLINYGGGIDIAEIRLSNYGFSSLDLYKITNNDSGFNYVKYEY